MADDVEVFHKTELPVQAFPIMEDIRRRGKLCDVTLKIADQRISAHRIVLASCIPYFNAMFTHDMVESKQDEISMQGIDPGALEALVNYAYNGKIQMDTGNVQSLLVGASFLQLQVVKDACCDFMKKRLHPNNVLGIRGFGDQFMCSSLVDACHKYIQKHFIEVCKTDEFLMLGLSDILEVMASDELYVSNEEQIFEAALTWVKHDPDNRKDSMPDLITKVRLPLMTPQYLVDRVGQEDLVKTSLKCRDLLDEAKDYHLMPERRPQLQTFKTRPRRCTDVVGTIYAVGGLTPSDRCVAGRPPSRPGVDTPFLKRRGGEQQKVIGIFDFTSDSISRDLQDVTTTFLGDSLSTVESFDPIVGRWRESIAMSTLRSRVGVSVLNGLLYAIGGYDGTERLNTVEVFDPERRKWQLVRPMICKRSALGAAALDDKLYVCGGYDGVSSLSSVECYDPETKVWNMVTHMSRHRSAAGVTMFDGHIYALGGHDGLSIFNAVECYNNLTGVWTAIPAMLTKRCRLGVAALNGKLYAAGGYDGNVFLKSVECYDPMTNHWSKVADMKVKRSRVALVADCGKLYAIGGYDGVTNLKSVEIYDPEKNVWIVGPPMCAHEGGVGVGVIPLEPK